MSTEAKVISPSATPVAHQQSSDAALAAIRGCHSQINIIRPALGGASRATHQQPLAAMPLSSGGHHVRHRNLERDHVVAGAEDASHEAKRLCAVRRYQAVDTSADGEFDRVTALAADVFHVPIVLISIVGKARISFASHWGTPIRELDRELGLCGSAILSNATTVICDASIDPETLANSCGAGSSALRFYAAAPLRTPDGFNVGTFCIIDKEPRAFGERETNLLKCMADLIMHHLELQLTAQRQYEVEVAVRDRMKGTIAMHTVQLRQLSHKLITTTEEERARLARELHDEMGSLLTVLTLTLRDIGSGSTQLESRLAAAHRDANKLIRELIACQRRIVESLRPILLDTFGLSVALQSHADDWALHSGIALTTAISPDIPTLDANVSLALFRLAQECLNNIAKHSHATSAELSLDVAGRDIRLCVADDGVGIAPELLAQLTSHGIISMRERLSLLDGTLRIGTTNGRRGTRVEGFVPMAHAIQRLAG